jgi:hypothetical protein
MMNEDVTMMCVVVVDEWWWWLDCGDGDGVGGGVGCGAALGSPLTPPTEAFQHINLHLGSIAQEHNCFPPVLAYLKSTSARSACTI